MPISLVSCLRSGVTRYILLMLLNLHCVPMKVTRSALVAHRHTYVPPRCRTTQYRRTFIPFSVSLWNDLADPVFDGVGLRVSRAGPMLFYWPKQLNPYYFSLSFLSDYRLVLWGCLSLSLSLALPIFF